ncbi:glycerol dehydrogenase [Bacillus aquiflavi]|uniref:Glycerol dehydrogenase n=1 Tax=Bacillus aquiflavi TaxID=2672567 RepID=A0A6B3VXE5_9BACI|nr:glycerol dehydrogenase [Bacillus aquiflavi]MBA4536578.1 glycerol dehydrogenase [Bacillus aquiflavi]NEY80945.1 glycerol dehydrogenase [Bacillus aquiflavi]UAC49660.1 glycerol dehydrogenase [Bacillus aquiflavi]
MTKPVKSVTSPKKFIIGQNLLGDLSTYTKTFGDDAYVICDEFILERAKKEAEKSFEDAGHKSEFVQFNYQITQEEIDRHREAIRKTGANVIVGIGGGKTLDTAKATAYYEHLPVVIFPTIASTDAPCTALAVIYNSDGSFDRYLFLPANPDVVLADTNILAAAPTRFFVAGIGDALATYFEARACYHKNGDNLANMKPSLAGLGLSKMCYDTILKYGHQAKIAVDHGISTPAVENTIEATIYLSGVGAEAGGLAAAHAIHNGMTAVPSLHKAQHGEKVVFGLLTQLVLENAPKEELETVIEFIKKVGLPLTLNDLGLDKFREEEWRKVAEDACAEGDTMGNMPHPVTPDDVYQAIIAANALAEYYHD